MKWWLSSRLWYQFSFEKTVDLLRERLIYPSMVRFLVWCGRSKLKFLPFWKAHWMPSEQKFLILMAFAWAPLSVPKVFWKHSELCWFITHSLVIPKRAEKVHCNVKRTVLGLMNLSLDILCCYIGPYKRAALSFVISGANLQQHCTECLIDRCAL